MFARVERGAPLAWDLVCMPYPKSSVNSTQDSERARRASSLKWYQCSLSLASVTFLLPLMLVIIIKCAPWFWTVSNVSMQKVLYYICYTACIKLTFCLNACEFADMETLSSVQELYNSTTTLLKTHTLVAYYKVVLMSKAQRSRIQKQYLTRQSLREHRAIYCII